MCSCVHVLSSAVLREMTAMAAASLNCIIADSCN